MTLLFKLILLITFIVVSFLVSLILLIIYFVKSERSKALLISSIVSILSCFAVTTYTIVKSVFKTKEGIANFTNSLNNIDWEANEGRNEFRTNETIELLKSYERADSTVNNNFYTELGFRDWYRYPIVYPYSINCVDVANYGTLFDETNVVDISEDNAGVIQLNITGITEFAFDQEILIAKLEPQFDDAKTEFVLFLFESGSNSKHDNFEELLSTAQLQGYTGPDTLMTILEYDSLIIK